MITQERQSNIELLRLIAIVGIIILHYNNSDIGGGFRFVESGSLNENVLYFLESISICGVNLFVMISGFFLARTNNRSFGKMLVLLIQVCLYGLINYLILAAVGRIPFSIKGMIYSFIPLNWFVTLYIVLYLISPLINRAFYKLKNWKIIVGLIAIFSVIPTVLDLIYQIKGKELNSLMPLGTNGSGRGYTIISFMLCYVIGAAINWINLKRIPVWTIGLIQFVVVICIFVWAYWNRSTAWEYCNPLIIAEAFLMISLFLRIEIGSSVIINVISKSTFSVFLIHQYLIPYLKIEQFVHKPVYIMVLHLLLSCLGIVLFSFIVDRIYHSATKWMDRRLSQKWTYSI